jgi:hypothetical protein
MRRVLPIVCEVNRLPSLIERANAKMKGSGLVFRLTMLELSMVQLFEDT